MQQAFWIKKLLFEFAPDEINFFNQNNKRLRLIPPEWKKYGMLFSPTKCTKSFLTGFIVTIVFSSKKFG